MKNIVLSSVIGVMLLSSLSFGKQVTICTSYVVGVKSEMSCSGGLNGKFNFIKLYKKGWHYVGDISGVSYSFMLVFEK